MPSDNVDCLVSQRRTENVSGSPRPILRLSSRPSAATANAVEGFGATAAHSVLGGLRSVLVSEPPARASRTIAWSGSMAQHEDPEAQLFDAHPRTWGPVGWRLLEERLRALVGVMRPGESLCIRPHAAHVVSDVSSCERLLAFAATLSGPGRLELLFDPVSMLTPGMFDNSSAHDVLTRAYEALEGPKWRGEPATASGLAGVLLANARLAPGVGVEPAPLSSGLFDSRWLIDLFARTLPHLRPGVPVVLLDDPGAGHANTDEADRSQLDLLRSAGLAI